MSPEVAEALRVLGAPEPGAPTAEGTELGAFASAAADAAAAAYFDWKVTNRAVLEELMARFDRDIPLDLRMDGNDCLILVEDEAGRERITRLGDIERQSRGAVVARFLELLPSPQVALKLVFFESSDCDVYLILPKSRAELIVSTLGPRAAEFVRVAAAIGAVSGD